MCHEMIETSYSTFSFSTSASYILFYIVMMMMILNIMIVMMTLQRLRTCQGMIDQEGLAQQTLVITAPKYHKRYILPGNLQFLRESHH